MSKVEEKKPPKVEVPAAAAKDDSQELIFIAPPAEFLVSVTDEKPDFLKKAKDNPLVPAGMVFTVLALGNGLRHMYRKNKSKQQQMMRLRVTAQGFSVMAILAGVLYATMKEEWK